jgi:hypothetical protein
MTAIVAVLIIMATLNMLANTDSTLLKIHPGLSHTLIPFDANQTTVL